MSQIEAGLHQLHASSESDDVPPAPAPQRVEITTSSSVGAVHAPFAKVNTVENGSPASDAGLRPGDYVKKFGAVHALNHERLTRLAREVQMNEGVS